MEGYKQYAELQYKEPSCFRAASTVFMCAGEQMILPQGIFP